jgi:hypothetical protein
VTSLVWDITAWSLIDFSSLERNQHEAGTKRKLRFNYEIGGDFILPTAVGFQGTTLCYGPEYRTLRSHHYETLGHVHVYFVYSNINMKPLMTKSFDANKNIKLFDTLVLMKLNTSYFPQETTRNLSQLWTLSDVLPFVFKTQRFRDWVLSSLQVKPSQLVTMNKSSLSLSLVLRTTEKTQIEIIKSAHHILSIRVNIFRTSNLHIYGV